MKKILVIGATSAIAQAAMRVWAGEGSAFYLMARNQEKLAQIAEHLKVSGASAVHTSVLDVDDLDRHHDAVAQAFSTLQEIEVILLAAGSLPKQVRCEADPLYALQQFRTNGSSQIALLHHLAARLRQQRYGTLAVISSVAGDRGRRSNYLYGSAKAAVSAFCEGLRGALDPFGVKLLLIKPGMVDTPMTAGIPMPGLLTASAAKVGEDIVNAVRRGKAEIYTPGYWRLIMWIIKLIPVFIFKRLKF